MSASLPTIVSALLPLLVTGAVGYVLRHTVLREESLWRATERLTFVLLIPALIVSTLVKTDFGALPALDIALAFGIALGATVALLGLIFVLGRGREGWCAASYTSVFQCATRWNASAALAIVAATLAERSVGLVAIAMVLMMPVVNVMNVFVLVRMLEPAGRSARGVARAIATNPIIVGCALGIALSLSEVALTPALATPLDALGAAAVPLVMLTLGAGLDLRTIGRIDRDVALSCALRLAVFPALVLLAARALALPEPLLAAAIVCAAVPTAANGYVLAREMGGDAPLYARICTLQVVLSLGTIPLWLALAGATAR